FGFSIVDYRFVIWGWERGSVLLIRVGFSPEALGFGIKSPNLKSIITIHKSIVLVKIPDGRDDLVVEGPGELQEKLLGDGRLHFTQFEHGQLLVGHRQFVAIKPRQRARPRVLALELAVDENHAGAFIEHLRSE